MWKVTNERQIKIALTNGLVIALTIRLANTPYQEAVSRFFTKLGDFLCCAYFNDHNLRDRAGWNKGNYRMRSWFGDAFHAKTEIGFKMYCHLKALIFQRRRHRGWAIQLQTGKRIWLG